MKIAMRLSWVWLGLFCLAMAQGLSGQSVSGSTSGGPGSGSTSGGSGSSTTTQQISLHIPDETAPPGGLVQMKVMVTEPSPVSTGGPRVRVPGAARVLGIELFNPAGDVAGVALIGTSDISIASISSTGTQGSDYPIMTIALELSSSLPVGSQMPFTLDPSSTWTLATLGIATMKPIAPATITAGGSISITNIVPGGGIQPAGSVIRIQGMGFQPGTQVQLSNIKASSITVTSPQEIQFVLAEPTQMTGKQIQVTNPDSSRDTYFSYMRAIPYLQSSQPLLASALPIFSSVTHSQAVFATAGSLAGDFSGIAVQNPNLLPATVTFNLFSADNVSLANSTVVIPSGNRIMLEISELLGVAPTAGSYAVVTSDVPVPMFGFAGDNVSGTVKPYFALSSQP